MEKKTIVIDGFEFPKKYDDVPDVENLNYYLEKMAHDFYVVDYLGRRHPEIFPGHIGLKSDDKLNLRIVKWEHATVDSFGEYAPGWHSCKVEDPEKYAADILAYYESRNPAFHNFIKDRIQLQNNL